MKLKGGEGAYVLDVVLPVLDDPREALDVLVLVCVAEVLHRRDLHVVLVDVGLAVVERVDGRPTENRGECHILQNRLGLRVANLLVVLECFQEHLLGRLVVLLAAR